MREIATVTSSGLNLHSDPRKTAHIVDTLTAGDKLEITKHPDEGPWLYGKVIFTKSGKGLGQEGWVDGSFVDLAHIFDGPVTPIRPTYGVSAIVIVLIVAVLAAIMWFVSS